MNSKKDELNGSKQKILRQIVRVRFIKITSLVIYNYNRSKIFEP